MISRVLLLATATVFAGLSAATSVWISRANAGDHLYFGSTSLWSTMDPAGCYIPDVILFFTVGPLSCDFHPGVPMTFMGAVLARAAYAVPALFTVQEPYVEFWVRHRIELNAMLALLTDAMWLACCHPLFKVLRHFMDRSAAYVGCTLFLTSIPVLLYISRFSPEAWMLFFSLWSIHLSLLVLDGRAETRIALAMGLCTVVAIFSKWLALPIVALNLFGLLRSPGHNARVTRNVFAYVLASAVLAALLVSKLSLSHIVERLAPHIHRSSDLIGTLVLPYESPFLVHHALVFGAGALGLAVIYRMQASVRTKLAALLATILLMALLVARRPLWHYFFGFYWLFPAAAAYGLTLLLTKRSSRHRDGVAVAAGFIVLAACHAWSYPGLIGTYAGYRNSFHQRAMLAKSHPAWVVAPWEVAQSGFETERDPALAVPVWGKRLDPVLQSQRRNETEGHQPGTQVPEIPSS